MNTSPTSALQPPAEAPRFTECLPSGQAATPPSDPREMTARLQQLIDQIQSQPNPAARALLQELLESLLAFYGDGLSRVLGHIQASDGEGKILDKLLHDQTVSGLLLIHGLHPLPLETRLLGALETVRPYMQSHGGSIELLSLEGEVARVKLQGTCKTCPSSTITLELAVRRAVEEACPDLLGFEVVADNAPEAQNEPKQSYVSGHSR